MGTKPTRGSSTDRRAGAPVPAWVAVVGPLCGLLVALATAVSTVLAALIIAFGPTVVARVMPPESSASVECVPDPAVLEIAPQTIAPESPPSTGETGQRPPVARRRDVPTQDAGPALTNLCTPETDGHRHPADAPPDETVASECAQHHLVLEVAHPEHVLEADPCSLLGHARDKPEDHRGDNSNYDGQVTHDRDSTHLIR